ncbi:hypothetical protein H4R99_006227 [Coemansia sp. RSA 1722]|nr:hypothetical protein LPJ57_006769 [Coemansia sp. RSA 486]KAJ2222965.1 hypothetical protein IWW45_008465 [Coemansia sp. RSA 485]KAJ2593015.1 hypothetical protein H4R99_006227 [Coemansia sp. RSA 1722]
MFSISAMSPPATPGGSIFSPRQNKQSWPVRALTLDHSDKRLKLDKTPSMLNRPMSPCGGPNSNVFVRTSTLAARRMKRMPLPAVTPLQLSQSEMADEKPVLSTGLSPIISGLSIANRSSTPKPAGLQIQGRRKPMLAISALSKPEAPKPEMTFRLQKPAPAMGVRSKAATVPRLNIGVPTGLISPPSATPIPKKRRPPPLSFGSLASPAIGGGLGTAPLSPSVPQTPSTSGFTALSPLNIAGGLMLGEASPSFYNQPTPPPIFGAPTFFVTPPSPAIVATAAGSEGSNADGRSLSGQGSSAVGSLSPCTPPWPKSGSSLRKTIFDHIGKSQLSPMDMRGYMAIAMNS